MSERYTRHSAARRALQADLAGKPPSVEQSSRGEVMRRREMPWRLCLFIAAATSCGALVHAARVERLTFTVLEQTRECLYREVEADYRISAMATVYHGGKLDVGFSVTTPGGRTVYDRVIFSNIDDASGRTMNGVLPKGTEFTADETGTYAFCFNNKMARWTGKKVAFELSVKLPRLAGVNRVREEQKAPEERMKATLRRMHDMIDKVDALQVQFRENEALHRDTAESNFSFVWSFTVIEIATVTLVAVAQVFLVQSWFANRNSKRVGV